MDINMDMFTLQMRFNRMTNAPAYSEEIWRSFHVAKTQFLADHPHVSKRQLMQDLCFQYALSNKGHND